MTTMERRMVKSLRRGPITCATDLLIAYIKAGGRVTGRYGKRDVLSTHDRLIEQGVIVVSNDQDGECIYALAR